MGALIRSIVYIVAMLLIYATLGEAQARYRHQGGVLLPDPNYTPGDVLTTDTSVVCKSGYSSSARYVTAKTAEAVYASYRQKPWKGVCMVEGCEVDHLISLELGGSNDAHNLWPQPYAGFAAHQKDQLENRLHRLVCSGALPLEQAQREIAVEWLAAVHKYLPNLYAAGVASASGTSFPPPSTITVKGHPWQIVYFNLDGRFNVYPAYSDHQSRTIYLLRGIPLARECANLHHEIEHAVTGFGYNVALKTGHDFIADTSDELVKVYFRDNPGLLAYTAEACRGFRDAQDDRLLSGE